MDVITPDYTRGIEMRKADLKKLVPGAAKEDGWTVMGFEIPTVETWDEAKRLLMEDGIPSFMFNTDGDKIYTAETIVKDLREEHDDSKYWDEFPSRLRSFEDMMNLPPMQWIAKDRIERNALVQIYAAPASGKTVFIAGLVLAWVTGQTEWMGHELCTGGEPQEVAYIAAEGGASFAQFLRAWSLAHPEIPAERYKGLYILDGAAGDRLNFPINTGGRESDVSSHVSVKRFIRELQKAGAKPSIVVYDTQIDLAPGINENDNSQVNALFAEVQALGKAYGWTSILVHHTGKDESSGQRGASSMKGKAEGQIKLSASKTQVKVEWEKVKGRDHHSMNADHFQIVDVTDAASGFKGGFAQYVPTRQAVNNSLRDGAPEYFERRTIENVLRKNGAPMPMGTLVELSGGKNRQDGEFRKKIEYLVWEGMLQWIGEPGGSRSKLDFAPTYNGPDRDEP